MKKTLLSILGCLIAVSVYSQNQYTKETSTEFKPTLYDDLKNEAQRPMPIKKNNLKENEKLNRGIDNLLNLCNQQLATPQFCYGEFKDVVISVKEQLDDINYRGQTTQGVSLQKTRFIFEQCLKSYNKALKKHNKIIERERKVIEKRERSTKINKI